MAGAPSSVNAREGEPVGVRSKVELFERIRLDRAVEPGVSIRELARRHGVHRRDVRAALLSPMPSARKRRERQAPKLGAFHALIDSWLEGDRNVPRKQRHTARRVWQRLVDEHDVEVTERAVAEYVRPRRRELGLSGVEGMVPQQHEPGAEAEVDWGQATVVLAGVPTQVHLFVMRASHSGASYVQAFLHETQQAFLEAHAEAFSFFGGVFGAIWYDNLSSAVRKVLRGRKRVETERFTQFRSHYRYASDFTLAGIRGAHEKGGVEGEVGRYRRRHLVPMPTVESLAELNVLLRAGCIADLARRITGRDETIGEALAREREHLTAVPGYAYVTYDVGDVRVSDKSLVCVRQNHYSVPCELIDRRVQVRIHARSIEVYAQQRLVAVHSRLGGRHGHQAQLDHYLEVMQRKPGALAGSKALAQERERGLWPAAYDQLWRAIAERYGPSVAARQMVDVLMLCREAGPERVHQAVREALMSGAHDGQAVAVLARRDTRAAVDDLTDLDNQLQLVGTAVPSITHYDNLLNQGDRS